ncbi:hypothetical protein BK010_10605 (plasmid) [Tenericutes bacterium MO-XQ]|nr:hypothetical protein BK010_10605 [Tenericutes bacterium MO-XQ]
MNDIYNLIKGTFPNTEILLIYYGGSKAYGLDENTSDIDVTIVLEGFKGILHLFIGKYDLFVFSKEDFIKRQQFDDSIIAYHRQAADNILGIKTNEYYLNPVFSDELEIMISNVDNSFICNLIDALLIYSKSVFEVNRKSKAFYHLYRVRGMIEHYMQTGVFDLIVDEPWKSKMIEYKANYKTNPEANYEEEIVFLFEYLENYRNEMIERGLG